MKADKTYPLVSVIIPTYKRPEMLNRAIWSVLNQTYKNIEIIVVDDNGADTDFQKASEAVCNNFKENIKYLVHKHNKGGSAARNTGWRNASGEYVTFLDDDDEIDSKKIEMQIEKLMTLPNEFGACYTGYHIYQANGKKQKSATKLEGDVYLQALSKTFYLGSGSNLVIRKQYTDLIGGYDESFKRNQDIEFNARLFEKCKVCFCNFDLLTIHQEVRENVFTFDFVNDINSFYLNKMEDRINSLEAKDKKKVLDVINLELARFAYSYHDKRYKTILKSIKFTRKMGYFFYLIRRLLTKKSYGFFPKN